MIRWLLAHPGPALDRGVFLSQLEADEGKRFRHPGRHRQWLLGRAAAKTLLVKQAAADGGQELPFRGIQVHRTPDGWPQPMAQGRVLPLSLSISHTGERALCAVCPEGEGLIGADIELVATRSESFMEDYYTNGERMRLMALPDGARDKLASVIWCIKEAVLKARRTGFHESATSVEVLALDHFTTSAWKKAVVEMKDGTRPETYWRLSENDSVAMAIAKITSSA
jgi:phosphopantetheinyl transferase